MRIGVIQASTRADINELLFALTCQSASHGDAVYNLGEMDSELLEKILSRKVFYHFLEQHATNKALMNDLRAIRD